MKKIIGIVVVLLVAGAFALPAIIGPATETQLRQSLSELGARQGVMDVEILDYERSYRGATATVNFGLTKEYLASILDDAGQTDGPVPEELRAELIEKIGNLAPVRIELEHGPVLSKFAKGVGLNSYRITLEDTAWLDALLERTDVDELLEIIGKTGLGGSSVFNLSVPAFDIDDDEGNASFSGLNGDGRWNNSAQRLTMDASSDMATFSVAEDGVSMQANGMNLQMDSTFAQSTLGYGTSTFNIASASVRADNQPPLVLDNVGFRTDANLNKDGLVDVSIVYSLDKGSVGENTVSDATATIAVSGLKPEVLQSYQEAASNPVMDAAQLAALQDVLYEALGSSPSINIGPIRFKANEETFDGTMTVNVDGSALPDADAFNVMDISMWMGLVTQALDVNATEGLVNDIVDSYMTQQIEASVPPDQQLDPAELAQLIEQQRPVMLEQLVGQGMITRTDNGYAIDVDFNKGEMTVNGNPFPIEALLGP